MIIKTSLFGVLRISAPLFLLRGSASSPSDPLNSSIADGSGGHKIKGEDIDFDPGYRVYYARAGKTLCQLLCVGNKSSQAADIKNAHAIWKELNPPARKPGKKSDYGSQKLTPKDQGPQRFSGLPALSPGGNPSFETVMKVVAAFGMRLRPQAA
jgi:hypothetical protein